jgi:hypothetical protein
MSPAEVEKLLSILDWISDSVARRQAERAALSSVKDSEFWRTYYKGEIAGLEKVGEELVRCFREDIALAVIVKELSHHLDDGHDVRSILLEDGTTIPIQTLPYRLTRTAPDNPGHL